MSDKDQFDTQAERLPDNNKVICPNCVHQFRAIPVSVQKEIADLRAERDELKAKLEKQAFINDTVYQGMVKENDDFKAQLACYEDAKKHPLEQSESNALKWMNEALDLRARLAELEKKP